MRTLAWVLWCWFHHAALAKRQWTRLNMGEGSLQIIYWPDFYFSEARRRAEEELKAGTFRWPS